MQNLTATFISFAQGSGAAKLSGNTVSGVPVFGSSSSDRKNDTPGGVYFGQKDFLTGHFGFAWAALRRSGLFIPDYGNPLQPIP